MKTGETESILRSILEITFDTSTDLIRNSRLLIKRPLYIIIYFSLLSFLSRHTEWTKSITSHCESFCENVEGSYWNLVICSKVGFVLV